MTEAHGERGIGVELLAGLTVAFVGLPQCIAYAMMAGLPPAYGLVTAAAPALAAALIGRSARIITGPTNTTGLLILGALAPMLGTHGLIGAEALGAVALLTLMAGVFRLAFVLLGGATIVRFLPESVLVGFTAGAGILIAAMQLDEAFGLPGIRSAGLLDELMGLWVHLREGARPAWPSLALAGITFLAIALGKRYAPRAPVALVMIVGATTFAWALHLDATAGLALVSDRASLPSAWPAIAMPRLDVELMKRFLFPALGISLLGTLELLVTARAGGANPDMRREIGAQGLANVVGAFTGAFPASASLTRSALLTLSGARSRVAAASAALWVAAVLLLFPVAMGFIPLAALAGVLFATASSMIDMRRIQRMWHASRATRTLVLVTLATTLVLPLEWAIISGTGLAMLWHLSATLHPRLTLYVPRDDGALTTLGTEEAAAAVVVEISGDVHFAAAAALAEEINALLPESAERVIVDLGHAHHARFGCLEALEALEQRLSARNVTLHLAGVSEPFCEFIAKAQSALHVTPADADPGESVRRALTDAEKSRG